MTDATTTRNVLILYGFFFVMLASLISAALQAINMDPVTRLLIYFLAWPFALASALIGLGSMELLEEIPSLIQVGFFLLVVFVPTSFLVVIGLLLLRDIEPIVLNASYIFIAAIFVILLLLYVNSWRKTFGFTVSFFETRRREKEETGKM